jgi:phenylpyruvate tautomerase PptA (4-oxalocrotonate tautomerase family)
MPYLQLDTPVACSASEKRGLAKRLGDIYARQMKADINRVTVAIRVLDEGSLWRCGESEPRPAGLLMCDIRRGRSAEQRAQLANLLLEACRNILGFRDDNLNLEFTQHAGDEMYYPLLGGLSDDWRPGEAAPSSG